MLARRFGISVVVSLFLCINFLIFARPSKQDRTLLVTGYSGELPIVEKDRHLYVAVDAFARLINASISYRGNQVVLSLPEGTADSQAMTREGNRSEFSRAFLGAAIEQISVIREWHSTLETAVQRGYPITEDWIRPFNDRAQKNLALVSVALSTESDRSAYDLLANEYNNMNKLAEQFLDANRSRTYIPNDTLEKDSLNRRILACSRSLEAMAASGEFTDDGSCH